MGRAKSAPVPPGLDVVGSSKGWGRERRDVPDKREGMSKSGGRNATMQIMKSQTSERKTGHSNLLFPLCI